MTTRTRVFKLPMQAPDDVSGLESLIASSEVRAEDVIAVLAKTEGNGKVNDFTRAYAAHSFIDLLCRFSGSTPDEVAGRCVMIMSGGCEGVMSPHATVFVRDRVDRMPGRGQTPFAAGLGKRLAAGIARSRDLLPEEIGTPTQVSLVAEAVRLAMADAELESAQDVHYVEVKGPLLTPGRIAQAAGRGRPVVATDGEKSMAYSNAAGGLGVALALGEVEPVDVSQDTILRRLDLYTTRGAASSGVELMNCEVLVLGNSAASGSDLVVGHSVLRDFLDADAVRQAMRSAGIGFGCCPGTAERERVVQVFAKCHIDPSGLVRGRRMTMLTDSDMGTRPARAVINAVVASVVGDPAVHVSGPWGYHQGPVGGGLVAVIARSAQLSVRA